MKSVAAALLVLLAVPCALAQPDTHAAPPPPSVTTTGEAEVQVVPDLIQIAVGVESRDAQLPAAKSKNDRDVAALIAVAKAHGVDPAKIQTDYISIEPYTSQGYYYVRRSIVMTTSDVPGFETLLAALVGAGANHVHSIDFKTSQLRQHRDEARRLAAKAAREKAELLAETLGRKAGRALQIAEANDYWSSSYSWWWGRWNNSMSQNVVQMAPASDGGAPSGGALAPGRIAVSARVTVSFALE